MQREVESRGINFVWHFTRVENLDGILSHGLLARTEIEAREISCLYNDGYRYDGCVDAVCCSIGFPNYKMFYSLRQSQPGSEWVVVALQPCVLWEKECAFCASNAASSAVSCTPLAQRKGKAAFLSLFNEIEGKPERKALGLPDACPTDPQAEVLVFGNIEPRYIAGVAARDRTTQSRLAAKYPAVVFKCFPSLFSARKDYEHWRS